MSEPLPAQSPDLVFGDPPPATADLVFGISGAPDGETIDARVRLALPPLGLAMRAGTGRLARIAAALPALQLGMSAQWDSRTERPLAHRISAPQRRAIASAAPAVCQPHNQAAPLPAGTLARHHDAVTTRAGTIARHRDALHLRRASMARHQDGLGVRASGSARHHDAQRLRRQILARHQDGAGVRIVRAARHQDAERLRRPILAPRQLAAASGRWHRTAHGEAAPCGRWARSAHQDAMRPPPGRYARTPTVSPPEQPFRASPHLLFCQLRPDDAHLLFGRVCEAPPGAGVVIPILGAYIVLNTVTLVRADTAQPIEIEQFTAAIDADSWTWGWSATLHADLMPLVRSPALGQHVELIATINGTPLRLVVERMGRDRRFADRRLKISGRGRAAWLADPHSPIDTRYNAQLRTAQQLLADALTINGVPLGWTLDWRITDWLVPAGAWSHTGTYIDAALRIAEAGGAYVQAHNTDQTLVIAPRYPAAPWDWPGQTPDIELPEDVVEVEGIEWHDKPAYNAVWIAGGEGGRRDRIRRTGTAADRYAPSIVDPLATAPEMTRQRGRAVLGDTGRQAHISLRLPVLPETGIIQPGQLVRYTESGAPRLGLSRAVSIDHRFPELWQTIRLETHELEPV